MRAHIHDIIKYIGEDPAREGLVDTPRRVTKAYKEWFKGYTMDPADVLTTFADGGEAYDEMILVRDIPFYSHCEHHMAPFFGHAHIAYIPNGRILGLSKFARLLEVYARRLQVQERLTQQVADALMAHLKPRGAAVSVSARHMCMESRGIQKPGTATITNVLRGVFRADPAVRAEFLSSVK